jgi:GWxTD domain-containing protein
MRRPGVLFAASVFLAVSWSGFAQTLPDLFNTAKDQIKAESWSGALKTLDQLEAESAKPGNESVQGQLVAPIAFYRGVCEANLDQTAKAEADFATFLREKPGSTIDHAKYSGKVIAAFEAASKEGSSEGSASLFHRYEQFKTPPDTGEKADDRWADGPIQWIITPEERAAWSGLTDGAERAEFVEKFWEKRNPKPGSNDNTARTGFDRRVAFADSYFRLDEQQRGSLTDPGMVFVLLGPPTRTGRKPIMANEERSISNGASLDEQWWMGARNSIHIFGQQATNTDGFRETWRYGREALPRSVSSYEVNVVFVTKKEYGRFVLQRDPATLSTLDAARQEKSKNAAAASEAPRGN